MGNLSVVVRSLALGLRGRSVPSNVTQASFLLPSGGPVLPRSPWRLEPPLSPSCSRQEWGQVLPAQADLSAQGMLLTRRCET